MKERFLLNIESVAFGGAGVGRKDGLVVFVPFTAPDDVAEVELILRKKTFARGRALSIVSASPLRTKPRCRYFGRCGGCSYQHILYPSQLDIKQKQVEDAFRKIGGLAGPEVAAVIGSPQVYGYRGKATLHTAKTSGGLKLGFMDISGGMVTDIDRCEIMHETINDQIKRIRADCTQLRGDEDITLWSEDADGQSDTVTRRVRGREFLAPRDGFFQANLSLADRMVEDVLRLLPEGEKKTIVDACCGCGLFSIFLAPHADRILGVEISEKAINCARQNAEREGIKNTEFVCGDVADVLDNMARKKDAVDVIVLDPPRTGLDPRTVAAVCVIKPADIIYISCNPATQARDIRAFCDAGYALRRIQPLDMFAQTEHIETIARLERP